MDMRSRYEEDRILADEAMNKRESEVLAKHTEAMHKFAVANAIRDDAMEMMNKIEQEKLVIQSRQEQIKLAIQEAKRLKAKGV